MPREATMRSRSSRVLRLAKASASSPCSITNLTNAQFPSSEFFYASDFHSRAFPTLAPAAHFTAAPPRMFLFTVEVALDAETP